MMEVTGVMEVTEVNGVFVEHSPLVAEVRSGYSSAPRSHRDLLVYRRALALAMEVQAVTASFPSDERFSLIDQGRRSSRSVCANIAEGWRKRRYRAAFISKLSDAEAEAAETQVWIECAKECGYLETERSEELIQRYEELLGTIVGIIHNADKWILKTK